MPRVRPTTCERRRKQGKILIDKYMTLYDVKTQQDLADRLHISKSSANKYIHDITKMPFWILLRMFDSFKIPKEEILEVMK